MQGIARYRFWDCAHHSAHISTLDVVLHVVLYQITQSIAKQSIFPHIAKQHSQTPQNKHQQPTNPQTTPQELI